MSIFHERVRPDEADWLRQTTNPKRLRRSAFAGPSEKESFLLPAERFEDFAGERLLDFGVAGDRFDNSGMRIDPERVRSSFAFEITARVAQAFFKVAPFHATATTDWMASAGSPRVMSATRSSKMS